MDTDTQIFEDIVAEFGNSSVLRYARLNLHVQDGIVTISGRVNSLAERMGVERVAERVAGIKTLILEIQAAAIPTAVTNLPPDTQHLQRESLPGLMQHRLKS